MGLRVEQVGLRVRQPRLRVGQLGLRVRWAQCQNGTDTERREDGPDQLGREGQRLAQCHKAVEGHHQCHRQEGRAEVAVCQSW